MHRVRTGGKGLARLTPIRRCAGFPPINHIGGDGENGERMLRAAVGGVFLQLFVEQLYQLAGNLVNAVVVVSIGRILAHRFKAGNHAA